MRAPLHSAARELRTEAMPTGIRSNSNDFIAAESADRWISLGTG